jgi:hypothetical protein
MPSSAVDSPSLSTNPSPEAAAYARRMPDSTPMGHRGAPQDIAYGVLCLASEEARFVTGTNSSWTAAVRRSEPSPYDHVFGSPPRDVPPAGPSAEGVRAPLARLASAPAHRSDEAALVRRAEGLRQSASLLGPAPGGARATPDNRHGHRAVHRTEAP